MKNSENAPQDFLFERDGVKVRFGLTHASQENRSGHESLEFFFESEGLDLEKKETLKVELGIKVESHGYGHPDNFRRWVTLSAKHAKPLELLGERDSHKFVGSLQPSFYPPGEVPLEITDMTTKGYRIKLPPQALQSLCLKFFPVKPIGELDF